MSNQLEDDLRRVLQLARAHKNKEAKSINNNNLRRHRHGQFLSQSKEGQQSLLTATVQGLSAIDKLDSNTRHIGDCSSKSVLYHRDKEISEDDEEGLQQRLDARRTLYKRHFTGVLTHASGQKRETEHVIEAAARAARSSRAMGVGIGAAVLTDSQTLYSASAIENGALMLCAERVVIMKMLTSHTSSVIIAMAICSEQRALLPFPCGNCRELLADCGDFPVHLVNAIGETEETTSFTLFPRARHSELTQILTRSHSPKRNSAVTSSALTDQIPFEVRDWTTQDVLKWLDSDVGLSQYHQVFERNHIDGCTLILLEGSDLQLLLGITHPYHRSRLLTSIDRLRDRELLTHGLDYTQLEDYLAVLDIDRVTAVAHLKSTFDRLDANHDGFLDFTQVKQALSRLRCTIPSHPCTTESIEASPQAVERLLHSEELFGKEAAETGNVSFPAFARAFAKLANQPADTSTVTQGAFAVHAFGPRLAVLDLKKLRQCYNNQALDNTLDEAGLVRLLRELGLSDTQSTELACRWLDAQETIEEASERMDFAQFITRYSQYVESKAGTEATSVARLQQLFRSYEPVHSTDLKPQSVVHRALTTLFPAVPSDEVAVWCAAQLPSKISSKDSIKRKETISFADFTLACLEFAAEVYAQDQEAALIKRSIRNDALEHRSRVVHLHSSGHVRMCPRYEDQESKRESKTQLKVAEDKNSVGRSSPDDDDDGKCESKDRDSESDKNKLKTRTKRELQVDEAFDRFIRRHRVKSRISKDDIKDNSEEEDEHCMLNAVEAAQAALELGAVLSREQVLRYLEREGLGRIRRRDISRAAFHRLVKRLDANRNYPRDLLLDIEDLPRQQEKKSVSSCQTRTNSKSPRSRARKNRLDYDEFLRQKHIQLKVPEWKKQVSAHRQKQHKQKERQVAKKSHTHSKKPSDRDSEDDGKSDSVQNRSDSSNSQSIIQSRKSHYRRTSHRSRRLRKRRSQRSDHYDRHHSTYSSESSTQTERSSRNNKLRSSPSRQIGLFSGFEPETRVASMVHGRGTIERIYRDYFVADVHFDSGRHERNVELSSLRILFPEDENRNGSEWIIGTRVCVTLKDSNKQQLGKIVLCRTDGTFDVLVNEIDRPRTLKRIARNALSLADKQIKFHQGAHVMVRHHTEYFRGKICSCRKDGTYDVQLLKSPQKVLQHLAPELLAPDNDKAKYCDNDCEQKSDSEMQSKFSRGDRIEARFGGQASFYPGSVEYVHPNGFCDISYDDGDEEERVSPNLIRTIQKMAGDSKQLLKKAADNAYESDLFDSD
ncbi:hypothetical protein F441_04416 [Plasmopara halstedii]|uniref:Cytidine deaminase n=1 Tax=Plasmopara halstedii TaxID=4781 RepID=A0A0P1AR33_PLAHL|nr:hypothetical protein F441_04416 [Plasmopara halstedii]CEG43325.1 hypothetical protein F441_04416 [Plasmopara halstedii]|eukprot:XP_024579694.1 hypothetical protein F441_04416 [Plasmopara halstedii]